MNKHRFSCEKMFQKKKMLTLLFYLLGFKSSCEVFYVKMLCFFLLTIKKNYITNLLLGFKILKFVLTLKFITLFEYYSYPYYVSNKN